MPHHVPVRPAHRIGAATATALLAGGLTLDLISTPDPTVTTLYAIGIGIALLALAWSTSTLTLHEHTLRLTRPLAPARTIALTDITGGVHVRRYLQAGAPPATLLVLNTRTRPLRLSGAVRDPAALAALADALHHHLPPDTLRTLDHATPDDLATEHPHAVPFHERHPWGVAWIVVAVACVLTIIFG